MEIEQLEKQLSVWTRLLYAVLGASITLLFSSFDQFLGVVWIVLQIAVTSVAFFLLSGKRWKALPLSKERANTILGYFLGSWILSLVPGILGADSLYYIVVFGYAIFILVIFRRTRKELYVSDEIFP
jgi:hypothetical protein